MQTLHIVKLMWRCLRLVKNEELSAREARNAYMKLWRAENKEKVKAANQRYWAKKSKRMKVSEKEG